jgi:hypothetical protein
MMNLCFDLVFTATTGIYKVTPKIEENAPNGSTEGEEEKTKFLRSLQLHL